MKYTVYFLLIGACLSTGLLSACTTTEETSAEMNAARQPPTQIQTDADRQAAYNSNAGYGGSVPDATPKRVPLGEQASGTNARQRVENINTNAPNNTTPETRVQRLKQSPVGDTLRPLPQ
ncbi:hypothetical protein [Hymenobacter sp. BT730]|uniref:hypothetical protein n=1 Tax=Hymenobacter sp. BT730 TaxID=3063332 RepID=UPI0026DFA81C|nr:hypothetical protein [Hymenobacter sp. BT730]